MRRSTSVWRRSGTAWLARLGASKRSQKRRFVREIQRKAGLVRRTPLRRVGLKAQRDTKRQEIGPDGPRRRTPPPRQKWAAWRNSQRELVKARSYGCESVDACSNRGSQVHHTFGRLGEPWASCYLVGLFLCMDCHERAHNDFMYRDRLRGLALSRLTLFLSPFIPEVRSLGMDKIRTDPPRAAFEWLTSRARSAGISPPGWKED